MDLTALAGYAGLGGMGAMFYWLKNIPGQVYGWALHRVTSSITVERDDIVYIWVKAWMAAQPYVSNRCRTFKIYGAALVPGEGLHRLSGKVYVRTTVAKAERGAIVETLHIRLWRTKAAEFLRMVRDHYCKDDVTKIRTFTVSGNYWEAGPRIRARTLDAALLSPAQATIVQDCRRFLSSEERYHALGVPWRRGYLLYGPPGTGKSTFVEALAGELKVPLYMLSLAGLNKSTLSRLFQFTDSPCIVLVEDVDRELSYMSHETEETETQEKNEDAAATAKMSGSYFAALLNAIDGIAAGTGRMLIFTANDPGRLDPALVRPGRIDLRAHFDYLSMDVIARMLAKFDRSDLMARFAGRANATTAEVVATVMGDNKLIPFRTPTVNNVCEASSQACSIMRTE